jgi:hypothetical protein
MVRVLQDRYGLKKREDLGNSAETAVAAEPEQVGFRW